MVLCRTEIDAHAEMNALAVGSRSECRLPLPTGKRVTMASTGNGGVAQVQRSANVRNQASSCERPTRARLGLPSARKVSDWTVRLRCPRVTNSQLWHRYGGRGPGPGLSFC